MTNIEKDVENEIKTTSISDSDQIKLLSDIIFNEVIQTKQYRFDDNRQNYIFARKMDGTIALGQDAELAINVVGPFHENSGNESIIRNQSMGKAEMLVLLSEDRDLLEDLTMFLKTERYLKYLGWGRLMILFEAFTEKKGTSIKIEDGNYVPGLKTCLKNQRSLFPTENWIFQAMEPQNLKGGSKN